MNKPTHIILHHILKKFATFEEVKKWHTDKGFRDIGYHYYVKKDGTIHAGRKESEVGAHCKQGGMNDESIGIAVEGCYEEYGNQTDKEMPKAQFDSVVELVKNTMAKYGIPVEKVKKHHDYASYKLCPGNYFPWDEMITAISKKPLPFSDIADRYSTDAIMTAYEDGVVNGFPDGTFKPTESVTREQLAVFYARIKEVLK